jgi:hypothetical protein
MDSTFTQFIEAYKKASVETKALIDSEEIGLFIDNLNTPSVKLQKKELLIVISNTILGVLKDSDFLIKLNNSLVLEEEVISKVTDFTSQKIISLGGNSPEISFEISPVEETVPDILQTVRTMSSDNNISLAPQKEAAYSSVQSAILSERKQ